VKIVAIDKLMYEESDTEQSVMAFACIRSMYVEYTANYSQFKKTAIQNSYRCLNEF
jgi:hypothetical protein